MTVGSLLAIGAIFAWIIVTFDDSRHDPNTFRNFPVPEKYRAIDGTLVDARPATDGLTIRAFYSIDCPIAQDQLAKFVALKLPPDRIERTNIIGIDVDPPESFDEVTKHAREMGLTFPVVHDPGQTSAKSFGVTTVPEWIVTDSAGRTVFRGSMDAQYASRARRIPGEVPNLLERAIADWFENRALTGRIGEVIGCPLPVLSDAENVAGELQTSAVSIITRSCVSCHKNGGSAPFALTEPGQIDKRADDIATVVADGLMPPWKPAHGSTPPMVNDRSLTSEEVDIIRRWSESKAIRKIESASKSESSDELPRPTYGTARPDVKDDDWPLGPPDLVLSMPEEFVVPSNGDDIYRCFVLPTGLTEDKFLTAVDVRPGNPRIVHHVFNYVDNRKIGQERDDAAPGPGYECFSGFTGDSIFGAMGGWTPGHQTRHFRDGIGLSLPKGSDIVMQVHYHPSGKVERDRTRIGLYFARKPVRQSLQWISACENPEKFALPAGKAEIDFTTTLDIPLDVDLHALTPHMHFLGRSIAVFAEFPDGRTMPLISIPDWDFNLQETYYLRDPLRLPRGSRIRILSRYDNSPANPYNPNRPPKMVRWGEESHDDMMIVFLAMTQASQDLTKDDGEDRFMELFFGTKR
jgi:hypothetical protein